MNKLCLLLAVALFVIVKSQLFSIEEKIAVITLNETNPKEAQDYVGEKLMKLEQELLEQQKYKADSDIDNSINCTCECIIRPFWEYVDYGYGKYCGADYTCLAEEPGCDSLDACCKTHDNCVTITGYCGSCKCNIHLANCSTYASGQGFCDKLEEARSGVLDDICFVLNYAPDFCGGCPSGTVIPPICQNYSATFFEALNREQVAQNIVQQKIKNK